MAQPGIDWLQEIGVKRRDDRVIVKVEFRQFHCINMNKFSFKMKPKVISMTDHWLYSEKKSGAYTLGWFSLIKSNKIHIRNMIYNMCSAPALIFILIAAQPREDEGKKIIQSKVWQWHLFVGSFNKSINLNAWAFGSHTMYFCPFSKLKINKWTNMTFEYIAMDFIFTWTIFGRPNMTPINR